MPEKAASKVNLQFSAMVIVALSVFPSIAAAAFGGNIGVEHFQWKELNDDGSQLLKESGIRQSVTGFYENAIGRNNSFIYKVEAKYYFGKVNYDGETQPSHVPVQSKTTYNGLNAGAQAGFRLGDTNKQFAWDIIGGLEVDNWVREIAGSTDIAGDPVGGAREEYTIFNLKIGTGPRWHAHMWHGRLVGGLKLPVATNEYLSKNTTGYNRDINLSPKGRLSPFLIFNNNIKMTNRIWLTLDVLYDSYRFGKSETVTAVRTSDGSQWIVHQPESRQDSYGLQAGIRMKF